MQVQVSDIAVEVETEDLVKVDIAVVEAGCHHQVEAVVLVVEDKVQIEKYIQSAV